MDTGFHVYLQNGEMSIRFGENDPQRAEILDAIATVMNLNERPNEADECRNAKKW